MATLGQTTEIPDDVFELAKQLRENIARTNELTQELSTLECLGEGIAQDLWRLAERLSPAAQSNIAAYVEDGAPKRE